jgi:PDZ domain/Sel1 repeat/Putative peptidoglycan binding domain
MIRTLFLSVLATVLLAPVNPAATQADSPEVTFWESVRDSKDPDELEAYLEAFPNGEFASLARIRLKKLQRDSPAKTENATRPREDAVLPYSKVAEKGDQKALSSLYELAGKGDAQALYRLGHLYQTGQGVEKDPEKAVALFCLAQDFGSAAAEEQLDQLRPTQSAEDAPRAEPPPTLPPDSPFGEFFKEFFESNKVEDTTRSPVETNQQFCDTIDMTRAVAGGQPRGWLGARLQTVTQDIAASLGTRNATGALVASVLPDSPAEKADLQAGDVILKWDGIEVPAMRVLPFLVSVTPIGKDVDVLVYRDGGEHVFTVTVGQYSPDEIHDNAADRVSVLGLTIAQLTEEARAEYGISSEVSGVLIVGVDPGSEAASKELNAGLVIAEIMWKKVATPVQFAAQIETLLREGRSTALILVSDKNGELRFVALPLSQAIEWYRKAAETGDEAAMNALGNMYYEGKSVPTDHGEAVRWYRRAMEEGSSVARRNLARHYDKGLGVEKDVDLAAKHFFEAYVFTKAEDRLLMEMGLQQYFDDLSTETRREVQRRLRDAGVYNRAIDGKFGPATRQAIMTILEKSRPSEQPQVVPQAAPDPTPGSTDTGGNVASEVPEQLPEIEGLGTLD